MTSPAWIEIDLQALRHNHRVIQQTVGAGVTQMPVVKADAYGHGAERITETLADEGVRWFAAATLDEGIALRHLVPTADICLIVPFPAEPDTADVIVRNRLTPLVSDLAQARFLHEAARRQNTTVHAHLETDTGIGRSGFLVAQADALARGLSAFSAVRFTGLATHFTSADDDPEFTARQITRFHDVRNTLAAHGLRPHWLHTAASAGLIRHADSHLNMVRPGLLTYGVLPMATRRTADDAFPNVRPVLTFKTRVALVRELPAEYPISYGRTHVLRRTSRVATLSVGYGDGYPRLLGNRSAVLIGGRRAPILGRVCMDMMMADVTDLPAVAAGEEVVLIGSQGKETLGAAELAALSDTIPHEIFTRLTARVPRYYRDDTFSENRKSL